MGTSVTVIADLYIIRMDYSFTHLLTQNIVVYGRFDMGRGGVRVGCAAGAGAPSSVY